MPLIAITAGIDAVFALASWFVLASRRTDLENKGEGVARRVTFFSRYLLFSFLFLALIAVSMGYLEGQMQMATVFIADIALWISLFYILKLTLAQRSSAVQGIAVVLLVVLAGLGSIYQLLGLFSVALSLGEAAATILSQMAAILMYAVWVPCGILMLLTVFRSDNAFVRVRSLMFGAGLLFITFSWALRLQLGIDNIYIISISSVAGFVLLLGGILYRQEESTPSFPSPVASV